MRYRVFSGPPGSGAVSPLEKQRLLFKEFDSLDGALGWARHLQEHGRVALPLWGRFPKQVVRKGVAEDAVLFAPVSKQVAC